MLINSHNSQQITSKLQQAAQQAVQHLRLSLPFYGVIGTLHAGRCCNPSKPTCGGTCCNSEAGEVCLLEQCVARGSSACGSTICSAGQQCASPDNICCGAGESSCAGRCCAAGHQCLSGQCVPSGSSACAGGLICGPGQMCSSGVMCCAVGAQYCGGEQLLAAAVYQLQWCGTHNTIDIAVHMAVHTPIHLHELGIEESNQHSVHQVRLCSTVSSCHAGLNVPGSSTTAALHLLSQTACSWDGAMAAKMSSCCMSCWLRHLAAISSITLLLQTCPRSLLVAAGVCPCICSSSCKYHCTCN